MANKPEMIATKPANAEIIGCAVVLMDAKALTTDIMLLLSAAVSLNFVIFV
jgi:hypothetical protein